MNVQLLSLPSGRVCVLLATLIAALLLRVPGIGWGLPPDMPFVIHSNLRGSYAFDEGHILSAISKSNPQRFDIDPHDYHWGSLHLELVLLTLDSAEGMDAFQVPWRAAYHDLAGRDFVRVYEVARAVSIVGALFTVWILFQIPEKLAGAFAGMLVAVSPAHVLQSDQIRTDVTMTALLALTLLIALRMHAPPRLVAKENQGWFRCVFVLGLAAGMAVAAKYSALLTVAAIALASLTVWRFWRSFLVLTTGAMLGFCLVSPYLITKLVSRHLVGQAVTRELAYAGAPSGVALSPLKLIAADGLNIIRFSIGLPAFLLALAGIFIMLQRRSRADRIVLAGIAGSILTLLPLRWPLVRYDLPIALLLGVCAGIFVQALPKRWRFGIAAVSLAVPLAGSMAQVHYMTTTHPANQILQRVMDVVPPGTAIARVVQDAPPLDENVYPMAGNPLLDDLSKKPPLWILTTDLAQIPYPPANMALLDSEYQEVARSEAAPMFGWATFGEDGAPQDWKYTHPRFVLYHKISP